jgi:DNA-binding NarL/FixJ family response regulator
MSSSRPPVVAVLNTNDDTVEMLRVMLETEGMVAVSAHVSDLRRGHFDFAGFLAEHDPKVIIYDIPPPYDRSWLFFEHLRALPVTQNRSFVLTSTNPARVHQVTNPDAPILEIIGKPYDLQMIIDEVKKAVAQTADTRP